VSPRRPPPRPGRPRQEKDAPPSWLVLILVGCLFFPTGIAAIVYACQAYGRKTAGDHRGAVKAAKLARLYTTASLVVWITLCGITGLGYLVLRLVGSG
jgi:Interferon-induced transmembrane protein